MNRRPLFRTKPLLATAAAVLAAPSLLAQSFQILHQFAGSDGAEPQSSLTADAAGNLYGTTSFGGGLGNGTVFELVRGEGSFTFRTLYSFSGGTDGAAPLAGLIMDEQGHLFGTAALGGASGDGVVFELVNDGSSWNEQTIHAFTGGSDGQDPAAGLVLDAAGDLFGTASAGGDSGTGAVFELAPGASGYEFRTLHSFAALPGGVGSTNADGATPVSSLFIDHAGTLYGTAAYGGPSGGGSVFAIVDPSGAAAFEVLHAFSGLDGAYPAAGVIADLSGNLYGTTSTGGANGWGAVFRLRRDGSLFSFDTLYSFTAGSDGAAPIAPLVMDRFGNLFGTAAEAGFWSFGTLFELVGQDGSLAFRTLYPFEDGFDGASPSGALWLDDQGNLYGTAFAGGSVDAGTVFELEPPPRAVAESVRPAPGAAVEITLSATDPLLANPVFTFAIARGPAHGSLSPISGGQVIYAPDDRFQGSDSFTFTASDSNGVSDPATVSIVPSSPGARHVVAAPIPPVVPVENRPFP